MHLKRLFFWGMLFSLLLAYIVLFERPSLQEAPLPPPPPEEFERVFQLHAQDILSVEVLSGDALVRIVRTDSGWRVDEPPDALLVGEGMDSFIAAIVDTVIIEVVDEDPSDPDQYGLVHPDATLRVYLRGTDSPQVLQLGRTAPAGVSLYARRADQKRVLLVGSYLRFSIRTLLDRVKPA